MIAKEQAKPMSPLDRHPGNSILTDAEWQATSEALRLTPREQQVCRNLFQGKTREKIADDLGIKTRTVRQHMESIHVKLNASNRVEVVLRIIQFRDSINSIKLQVSQHKSSGEPIKANGENRWRHQQA